MACCGQGRTQLRGANPPPATPSPARAGSPTPPAARQFAACFEYTGATALTVIGPVTGQHYRFGGPGARALVDLQDRRAVALTPHLREVRNPNG